MAAGNKNETGNPDMKDPFVWHIIEEKRLSEDLKLPDGSNLPYEVKYLKRDDGLIVERIGIDREKFETFLFKGKFGQFKIYACRWDEGNDSPSDQYIVYLISNRGLITEAAIVLSRSHAKVVESALLHFPNSLPFFNNVPVKDVVFNTGTWVEPNLIRPEEAKHGYGI